ncbi:hypothetical protein [Piscinibacter sp. XHJ-5]|uniref:hypothetical protein n=1 Tax=Piscinibacter sp. XHJ-5 TaxID=3037797 RepID=UPI0024529B44|nr:hypothetical protein [Piscinibacter sp. XHJ-5]
MRSPFVHRVLGAALAALGGHLAAAASPSCDAPAPQVFLERFVPADCEACWQRATPRDRGARQLVLDWIVPAGDAAPLASAALPEAARRVGTAARETQWRSTSLRRAGAPQLRIADGPGWNGYVGLRLVVTRRDAVPPDAVAYAALVERVPAGSEGTPVDRQLVRAVIGPLGLGELAASSTLEHMSAVRLPDIERPDRLGSVAWIETAQGKVIAAAQSCAAP